MKTTKLNSRQKQLLDLLKINPNHEFTIKEIMIITGERYFSILNQANALYYKVKQVSVYQKKIKKGKD